jgi:hypothetical protein
MPRPHSLDTVLYVRVKKKNFDYVCERAKERGTTRSAIVDKLIYMSSIKKRFNRKHNPKHQAERERT